MFLTELFRRPALRIVVISVLIAAVVVSTVVLAVIHSPVHVDSIVLDRTELSFSSLSQYYRLQATTEPAEIDPARLEWSSSDSSVASVSDDGVVTPRGNGQAVITVCGETGEGKAQCTVSVSAITALYFERDEVTAIIGGTQQLRYTAEPYDVDLTQLIWSSSDPSTVSVNDIGIITAKQGGEAKITVSTADGALSDTCTVLVVENVPVQGISFDVTEFLFDELTDSLTLTPIFAPVNTSQRELTWISTDESVVTVDGQTGVVTPLSNGTAEIIAKSVYGDFSASCTVTVNLNIPLKGISLPSDSYTFTALGQIYLISPVFDPINASNKTIRWTSSDPSVATVSDSGIVTAVKKGTTTVKLLSVDGGFTAEFHVTVAPASHVSVTGVSLQSYTATLKKIGDTVKISASVKPSNATETGLRYTSQNTSVATVTSSGVVTAKGYGTTQITVTSVDGGYSENFTVTVPEPTPQVPSVVEQAYVKGVWVATVSNINFPSKAGLTANQLKAEIDTIMDNIVQWGLNTVYFQVRPSGDALYPSDYYPASAFVVSKQGNALPFDVLEYAIEAAHARGISFHAWINPYRVTTSTTSTNGLAASNPAVKHPEWVLSDGGKLYLNPGIPEVRQYILNGVMEIVQKYDVDGIHFDDYFYPDITSAWDDSAAYAAYGNGLSLNDWRRSNNDALVKSIYTAIKAYDASVSFGISPAAVWALASYESGGVDVKAAYQTYSQAFADTKKWVEQGWLDYICPQVYFQFSHSTAPFKPIVDWWNDLVAKTDVSLYIGIGAYRCADTAAYRTGTEIPAQLDYLDSKEHVDGAVFYNYGSLLANYADVGDQVKDRYYREPISLTLQFNQDSITVDSSYKTVSIVGVSDPNFPLYANGKLVQRTLEGYFDYTVTLTGAKTVVQFVHKGKTVDYVVNRTSSSSTDSSYMDSFGFVSGSFTPAYDTADQSGTKITFSCTAPAGSTVTVKVGSYTVTLTTTTKDPGNGKYLKATYTGTLTLPQVDGNANATLGYAVFYATRGNESISYSPGALIEVINDPYSYAMTVSTDKSDVRPNLEVDPELYYIATQGSKVYVVSKGDGTVKLTNGMYLSVNDVTALKNTFALAEVRSSSLTVTKKYTTLSLSLSECTFHTVWMGNDAVEITLYNLSGTVPSFTVGENPLFSGVKIERVDDSTVRIRLTYKASKHIYGYDCSFNGTTLNVHFRNPVTLSQGDQPLTGVVISLDPGHSQSSGAVYKHNGKDIWESELSLTLSRLVAEKLRAMGATVILTHEGEQTYSLDELIEQFRALSPDANVSIHFNSATSLATGTETFWCYGNSQLLGETVLKTFTDQTGFAYRRNACDYYKVSRLCEFPSILFETAFMSNPKDLAYFMDEENMDTAAEALAAGILEFFKEQNN